MTADGFYAALLHLFPKPFRADELNSVSCKGARGVSDVFASALWAPDTLFHLARVGVDGVNIHTLAGAPYEPFAFTHSGDRWQAQVKPMYYGLLLFARAAPAGSRLLATFHVPVAGLRTWATKGPSGTLRILLINDSPTRPLTLAVRPPHPARSATLERLLADGLRATSGVTLAGQTSTKGQLKALAPIEQFVASQLPVIPTVYGAAFDEYNTSNFTGWPTPTNAYESGSPNTPTNEVVVLHLKPVA